jgi:hypothetical protein
LPLTKEDGIRWKMSLPVRYITKQSTTKLASPILHVVLSFLLPSNRNGKKIREE